MSTMDISSLLNDEYKRQEGKFVSLDFLKDLITEERVEKDPRFSGRFDRNLLETITNRPRLFAILVVLKREEDLKAVFEHFGDDDTFFYSTEGDVPEEIGDRRQGADFFKQQAHFPPPLTRDFPPRKVSATFRPPFTERDDETRHGAYGIVRRVKLARGHLLEHEPVRLRPLNRRERWLTVEQDGHLACKSIEKNTSESMEKIREEVKTLKNRQHEHIVPLVACYETPAEGSRGPTLHILFPWADGNMSDWIHSQDTPRNVECLDELLPRKEYLYDTILSILSALAYLHSIIDHTIASHHDLKPENILRFGKVWKICDFGKSHLRTLEEGSETSTIHLGTKKYQPPEYGRSGIRHGRAFDIWSMGCIIVELAVLIVHGWETQKSRDFTMAREDASRPGIKDGERDDSFHNNMPVVRKWMKDLEHEDGSRNFRYLMETASTMLSAEREARPYSWEIEIYLHEAFHPNEKGSDRRAKIEKLAQPPPEVMKHFHGHNPLARALYENDSNLIKCLQKKGWKLDLFSEANLFVADSMSGAADVVSLLESFRPSPNQMAQIFTRELGIVEDKEEELRREKLAQKIAERMTPTQLTFFEIKHLLEQKHPVDRMRILAGEVDVNHMDGDNNTALFWAAWGCDAVAVDVLLRYGAKVDPVNKLTETPLMVASKLGHADVVRRLLQEGLNINFRDRQKRTSLSYAAQFGRREVVRLLLDKGADPNIRGQAGRTPSSLAAGAGNKEVFELLESLTTETATGVSPLTHAMAELKHRLWKGEEKDTLHDYDTIIEKLRQRYKVDEKAVEEVLQQRNEVDPRKPRIT